MKLSDNPYVSSVTTYDEKTYTMELKGTVTKKNMSFLSTLMTRMRDLKQPKLYVELK